VPSYRTHAAVPHWLLRDAVPSFDLKPSEVMVFVAVCDQLDGGGRAKVSQSKMVSLTGLSRSTVQAALTKLLKLHLIEQTWHAGTKTAAQYMIPEQMPWPASPLPAPTVRDEAQIRQRRRA
jgi:hypothetical protein